MIELYLFLISVVAIGAIVARRWRLHSHHQKVQFKEKIAKKVDELRKERSETEPERFKDTIAPKKGKKKVNLKEFQSLMRKADYELAKKKYNDAKQLFIQALSYNPDDDECNFKLAVTYYESDDAPRAEQILSRLSEENVRNPEIHVYLGRLHTKKKNYPQAVSAYVKAVEIDDKNDQTLAGLGRLYDLLMHPSLAAECYRRAAELQPRNVDYLFALAETCSKDDDYENALFALKKILTIEPYNDDAKKKAADIENKMLEFENAITQV